ncbi:MAG: hypothetical protein ABI378_07800 [Chitinophagaceae bacterium]
MRFEKLGYIGFTFQWIIRNFLPKHTTFDFISTLFLLVIDGILRELEVVIDGEYQQQQK